MKTRKLRRVGDIMLDMEKLLFELHIDHDMQKGEVLALVDRWQEIHYPEGKETYTIDKTHPVFYYGHRDGLK